MAASETIPPIGIVAAPVRLVRSAILDGDVWRSAAALTVTASEPVLAGHFPGAPVLPGVCVIESVQRAARIAPPPHVVPQRLTTIESARFTDAIRPGDEVEIALEWRVESMRVRCVARASTQRGPAAMVRLGLGRPATSGERAGD